MVPLRGTQFGVVTIVVGAIVNDFSGTWIDGVIGVITIGGWIALLAFVAVETIQVCGSDRQVGIGVSEAIVVAVLVAQLTPIAIIVHSIVDGFCNTGMNASVCVIAIRIIGNMGAGL